MSSFLDRFEPDPDPDMASIRQTWTTDKPLLREAVVSYAPPYPDYPGNELESNEEPSSDPSCPSARHASDKVEVALYSVCGNGFGAQQQRAWEFLTANAAVVESSLRRKLVAKHLKLKGQFLDEDLPDDADAQTYWKQIEKELDMDAPSAIDHVYKLVGISLIDSGLDDHGFISFEFQSGWDQDHGTSILMHKENVLAAGGMGEFTVGGDMVAVIKAVQAYDLDEGDLSLLET